MLSGLTKSLIVFGTTVLSVSLLTACAYLSSEPPPTSYSYPVSTAIIPESDLESLLASDDTTETSEETVYTGLSVETEPHNNPFGDYIYDQSYNSVAFDIIDSNINTAPEVVLGFDNPCTLNVLQNEVYKATGVYDETITLSDVNYFQNNPFLSEYVDGGKKYSEKSSFQEYNGFRLEGARAVLSSLGLRFGIDEIPASYLMERFPRLYYDQLVQENCLYFMQDISVEENDNFSNLTEVEDQNYLDVLVFISCMEYNCERLDFVYANPYGYGCITQVRDSATGKNVLVPSDKDAEAMQEDINSIPGCENLSIYVPETAEEFYSTYGYYPDDILQNVGSVNTKEAFEEYYNSLPESDQNELYAPILFN